MRAAEVPVGALALDACHWYGSRAEFSPAMADVLSVDGEGATLEVETEYEDNAEEPGPAADQGQEAELAEEVDEEECASDAVGDGNYVVPEANREVWKQFGCNTEAGRMLRRLYGGSASKAAVSKVSYPRLSSPATRWEPGPTPQKPCPQRAAVRVPRPTRAPRLDPDDPRNWRVPLPGRKPASDILAEIDAFKMERPDLRPGRNQDATKQNLQDRFQYCGGRMMPPAAMGHVPDGVIPEPAPNVAAERRRVDENGMTAEQREIFEELSSAVKRKQERLAEIASEETADPRPSKLKTERNKEALQLRNDITRCLNDIKSLLELTDD